MVIDVYIGDEQKKNDIFFDCTNYTDGLKKKTRRVSFIISNYERNSNIKQY